MLEKENHNPLCSEYTTQMYTKKMQNFMDMTTEDFSDEQVLNLDEDKTTNFAVYNDKTALVSCQNGANQMTDNGGGSYTFQNAGTEIASLRAGDTFAYTDAAGEVSIIKVKTIQTNGSTVTITEDENVELEDVFDYVKIEGGYQQEESQERAQEPRAGYEFELDKDKHSKTEEFNWTKKLSSGDLTATLKASGALTAAPYVKIYLVFSQQYVEFTLTMKASFDCSADGKLARQSVELLPEELSFPVVGTEKSGVSVTFMPRLEFEASGNVSFSAEMVTTTGFSYDSKSGFADKSSGPQLTKCDFHVEAVIYLGLGFKPGMKVVIGKELANASLDLQVGAQITAKMDKTAVKQDVSHICKTCIAGDIQGKLKLKIALTAIFIGEKSADLVDTSKKLSDFYYSMDYNEFGWTTCPHIACKVTLSVTDKDKKPVAGAAIEGTGLETAPVTDGNGRAEFYLPNGSYTLKVTKESMSETTEVQVQNAAKNVSVQFSKSASPTPSAPSADGTCGVNLEWKLGEDGTLTISGTGNMTSWSGNTLSSVPWYFNRKKITSVVLGDGVTSIGAYAFYDCENLTSVKAPDGITDIGDYAFNGCKNLSDIVIPAKVKYIGNNAFYGCSSLPEVKIPEGATNIGNNAFLGCTYLLRADIGGGTIGNSAFSGCTSLTTVTLGNKVASIGNLAFYNCASLKSTAIPDSIKRIGENVFYGCTSLSSIDLGNEVTAIGNSAFSGCTSLSSVTLPSSVNTIGGSAFSGCTGLSSVTFPSSVSTIGNSAFSGCTRLSSVNLGDGVAEIGYYAFRNCTQLGSVTFPSSVSTIGYEAFSGCTSLSEIRFTGSKPSISWNTFFGVTATVHYPASWGTNVGGDYSGNLTWVSSGSSGIHLFGEPNAALSNQEQALQPSGSENTEQQEVQSGVSQENPNERFIESEPPTAQAFTPLEVSDARAAVGPQTEKYTGRIPGEDYVLLVSKDLEGADPLAPSNLLYIAQGRADSSGNIAFTYIPRTGGAARIRICGRIVITVILSASSYVYTGQAIKPDVTVKKGETILTEGTDYTLSYENNIDVGTASVIVTGTGGFYGTITRHFTIEKAQPDEPDEPNKPVKPSQTVKKPAKTQLTRMVNQKGRKLTVRWMRKAKVSGYQIQYSIGKKFGAGTKKVNVAGAKKTSRTIGRLKKGKNYYVRIRTYKKAAGKIYYSKWSNAKKIKIKK